MPHSHDLPPIAEAVAETYKTEINEILERAEWLRKEAATPRYTFEKILESLESLRCALREMKQSVTSMS